MLVTEVADAREIGSPLGVLVGELGDGLGRTDADAGRNLGRAQDLGPGSKAQLPEIASVAVEAHEHLIDRIGFDVGREGFEDLEDPSTQVGIERVVGGEPDDVAAFRPTLHFVPWFSHADAQRLGFGRSGDDAAVVVRQDDDGPVFQARVEGALAEA